MNAKILLTLIIIWAILYLLYKAVETPIFFQESKAEIVCVWALIIDTVLIFIMSIVTVWA